MGAKSLDDNGKIPLTHPLGMYVSFFMILKATAVSMMGADYGNEGKSTRALKVTIFLYSV